MSSRKKNAMATISLDELAARLASTASNELLVVDVRGHDFEGGNIPTALNVPSRQFSTPSSVEAVITTHILPRLPTLKLVVVHCMRSQYRGPMAALQLRYHPAWPDGVECVLLKGGYQAWAAKWKGRPKMFENLSMDPSEEFEEEEHSVELRTRAERGQRGS